MDRNGRRRLHRQGKRGRGIKVGHDIAWESNVAFLRQQMQSGIPKIAFEGVKIDAILEDGANILRQIAKRTIIAQKPASKRSNFCSTSVRDTDASASETYS